MQLHLLMVLTVQQQNHAIHEATRVMQALYKYFNFSFTVPGMFLVIYAAGILLLTNLESMTVGCHFSYKILLVFCFSLYCQNFSLYLLK